MVCEVHTHKFKGYDIYRLHTKMNNLLNYQLYLKK